MASQDPPRNSKPVRGYPLRELGARLQALRFRTGLTQVAVAERLGLRTAESVSRYERGHREPRYSTLVRLCAVLGVEVEEVLPRGRTFADYGIRVPREAQRRAKASTEGVPPQALAVPATAGAADDATVRPPEEPGAPALPPAPLLMTDLTSRQRARATLEAITRRLGDTGAYRCLKLIEAKLADEEGEAKLPGHLLRRAGRLVRRKGQGGGESP
jgi:transcriptional regulator with XRE-family HTH domain